MAKLLISISAVRSNAPVADKDTKGFTSRREELVVGDLNSAQLNGFTCLNYEPKTRRYNTALNNPQTHGRPRIDSQSVGTLGDVWMEGQHVSAENLATLYVHPDMVLAILCISYVSALGSGKFNGI